MSEDPLALLRDFRRDIPEPDTAAIAAARARLLAGAATATASDQARTMSQPRRHARPERRARRRRLLVGGAIGALTVSAALAAFLLLQTPNTVMPGPGAVTSPPEVSEPEPTATTVLVAAATAASRAPEPRFGPGKYWYVLERGVKLGTSFDSAGAKKSFFYQFRYERETWWALDGSLSGHESSGRAEFLDGSERAAWIAAGRPDLGLPNRQVFPRGGKLLVGGIGWLPASYEDLVDLPTDPARLAAVLTERIRANPNSQSGGRPQPAVVLFGTVSYLLQAYPLPPELRAAFYRVLTQLDGVELIGSVTDMSGRRAVAVGILIDKGQPLAERSELLLDPDTGRLLGSRSVLAREVPGWRIPAGTLISESVYLDASVVDSPTARPASAAITRQHPSSTTEAAA
jgi:hypothetical protein